jgi:hypothetical protein
MKSKFMGGGRRHRKDYAGDQIVWNLNADRVASSNLVQPHPFYHSEIDGALTFRGSRISAVP